MSDNTELINKSRYFTNEIFKGKTIPDFIKTHKLFTKPNSIRKIFPDIGLSNFEEICDIATPLLDLKKDNYILNLINALNRSFSTTIDSVRNKADQMQFLEIALSEKDDEIQIKKMEEIYNLVHLASSLHIQLDGTNYTTLIHNIDGKIVLRPHTNIVDNNSKIVFKNNMPIFRIIAKLKEMFNDLGCSFFDLEQIQEYKTFCAENVPDKKYMVMFSSDGEKGAWDLLTMSMRGLKSCQRWDGEYRQCLIGSIVSKYVGIIYLTSGADFDGKGAKMMRRCLVKYLIDTTTQKPCIIIDKMYPEHNDETLKAFTKALQSRTKIPIHYSQTLQNAGKIKHFYIPFEKRRAEIPEKEWSYSDVPYKTNLDYKMYILNSVHDDDYKYHISLFKDNLSRFLNDSIRDIVSGSNVSNVKYKTMLMNIRNYIGISKFLESFYRYSLNGINFNGTVNITNDNDVKHFYRSFLFNTMRQIKQNAKTHKHTLMNLVGQSTTENLPDDQNAFIDFMIGLSTQFIKKEFQKNFGA